MHGWYLVYLVSLVVESLTALVIKLGQAEKDECELKWKKISAKTCVPVH